MSEVTPPLNVTQLNNRLQDVADLWTISVSRARVMLSTIVLSQMLPDTVAVKGGMGIKLRLGERGTRATADFDVSARVRGDEFEHAFRGRLAYGWGTVPASVGARRRQLAPPPRVAFTGTIRPTRAHDPGNVPPGYLVRPFRVSIAFLGRPWSALDVEVSDPEIEPLDSAVKTVDSELANFGAMFGFGQLEPVELIGLEHQIAQKIHAVTDPEYVRAHDLVDLQLLWSAEPNLFLLRNLCVRTFAWRRRQAWPPLPLRRMDEWARAYLDAREETTVNGHTDVLPEVSDAREWLGDVIALIASTEEQNRAFGQWGSSPSP